MTDWNLRSCEESIQDALMCYETDRYRLMVENCKKAVKEELNWPNQMSKISRYLKGV